MSWAHASRVWALIDLHRYAEAAQVAADGLREEPDDVDLLIARSAALLELDELAASQRAAESAVSTSPGIAECHVMLARVLNRRGKRLDARRAAQQAVELEPWSPRCHAALVDVLVDMMSAHKVNVQRYRPEALHHAMQCQHLAPGDVVGSLVMCRVAAASGEWATADAWARHALSIDPESTLAHQILGLAAKERGDLHAASEHLVAAGSLDPHDDSSTDLLKGLTAGGLAWTVGLVVIAQISASVLRNTDSIGVARAVAAVAALLGSFLGAAWLVRRRKARSLSQRAITVLEADRRASGGSLRNGWTRMRRRLRRR